MGVFSSTELIAVVLHCRADSLSQATGQWIYKVNFINNILRNATWLAAEFTRPPKPWSMTFLTSCPWTSLYLKLILVVN